MLKFAGLAIAALAAIVIVAVGYWSHRGSRHHGEQNYDEHGYDEAGYEQVSFEAHSEPVQHQVPVRQTSSGTRVASVRPGPTGQGARTYRQGEDVAKSKSRFGLGERMGWLKRADRDAEMWPEETFGGVSDEQFWDDMSSDKPLATTARTAQPEGEARRRPVEAHPAAPPKPMPGKQLPVKAAAPSGQAATQAFQATQSFPATTQSFPATTQSFQATTQSFPASAMPPGAGAPTGPQPVRTGPQPVLGLPPRPVHTGPQPALTGTGPVPIRTGQQPMQGLPPRPAAAAQAPLSAPAPLAAPPATPLTAPPQPTTRGRHSTGEDPLTSDAFSLRSSTDGRSYRSARRSTGASRDQYEAAPAQDTQAFSLTDSPSGAYPAQQQYEPPQRGRRHAGDRPSGAYPAQPGPADSYGYGGAAPAAASQYSYGQVAPASPYGDSYDYREDDSRRTAPARETAARESAVSGRPPRPVYSSGSHRIPHDPRGGERRLTGHARR